MADDSLKHDPQSVIERCVLDFVRRGGINEKNASEVAFRVVGSLNLVCGTDIKGAQNART